MDKVRVGIIGCGAFAKAEHLPNCYKNPKIEILWCCSRSQSNRDYAEKKYHPRKLTPNADDVFQDPNCDMVILAVPHNLHLEMIEKAAQHKKHILCEKPMSMNTLESYRIVKAVQKAGVKLCVDYNRRFAPSILDLKNTYLKHRSDPQPTPWKFMQTSGREVLEEEKTSMLMISINDESSTYRPVHIDYVKGGGQIIGEGCHWLDLSCYILEDEPISISATGSSRMNYIITMEFRTGHKACIFFSSNGTFDYPKELYHLTDNGALFVNHCFTENEFYGLGEPMRKIYPLQFDDLPETGKEGGVLGYVSKLHERAKIYAASGKKKWIDLAPDKGHYNLLDSFLDSIIKDTPSPVNEIDGSRATYLSMRAIESIRLGKPLPVNQEDYNFFVA